MTTGINRVEYNLLNDVAFDPKFKPLYPILEHIFDVLRQSRTRTGGDEDLVADIEVAAVSEDGGNRSNRFIRDEVDNLHSLVVEKKRVDYRDDIDKLWNALSEIKPPKDYRDEISLLFDAVADLKRKADHKDEIDELKSQVDLLKTSNRTALQLIQEMTERYDSGT